MARTRPRSAPYGHGAGVSRFVIFASCASFARRQLLATSWPAIALPRTRLAAISRVPLPLCLSHLSVGEGGVLGSWGGPGASSMILVPEISGAARETINVAQTRRIRRQD